MGILANADGFFDVIEYDNNILKISGWMIFPDSEVDAFAVYINGQKVGIAERLERIDVARAFPQIPHSKYSGFSFSFANEGRCDVAIIRVVGVLREKEIAKIETIYVFDRGEISKFEKLKKLLTFGTTKFVYSEGNWKQYGDDFISDINPKDEMFITYKKTSNLNPAAAYFAHGFMMITELEEILKGIGCSFETITSFLDFACGYGRVTRFLVQRISKKNIVVSDIDRKAVDFCRKTFGVNGFYSTNDPNKLDHNDKYNVILVASLFSHLSIELWSAWLKKLYDMLEDNGVLLFSTHGDYAFELLDTRNKSRTKNIKDGFLYLKLRETSRLSTKEYGTTYVNRNFVENFVLQNNLGKIINYYPRALCNHQDIYVIKK